MKFNNYDELVKSVSEISEAKELLGKVKFELADVEDEMLYLEQLCRDLTKEEVDRYDVLWCRLDYLKKIKKQLEEFIG